MTKIFQKIKIKKEKIKHKKSKISFAKESLMIPNQMKEESKWMDRKIGNSIKVGENRRSKSKRIPQGQIMTEEINKTTINGGGNKLII